jgi:hypothetical protein
MPPGIRRLSSAGQARPAKEHLDGNFSKYRACLEEDMWRQHKLLIAVLVIASECATQVGTPRFANGSQTLPAPGIVSGLLGKAWLGSERNVGNERLLRFRDTVAEGDRIRTQPGAFTEILFTAGLLTLWGESEIELQTRTSIVFRRGVIEFAVAGAYLAANESMEVRTPNGRVRTREGIVRITSTEAQLHSSLNYSGNRSIVLVGTVPLSRSEEGDGFAHVVEGTVEIIPSSPEVNPITLSEGKNVRIVDGMELTPIPLQHGKPIPAIVQHREMSVDALEYLVTRHHAGAQEFANRVVLMGPMGTLELAGRDRLINLQVREPGGGQRQHPVADPPTRPPDVVVDNPHLAPYDPPSQSDSRKMVFVGRGVAGNPTTATYFSGNVSIAVNSNELIKVTTPDGSTKQATFGDLFKDTVSDTSKKQSNQQLSK